MSPSQTDIEIYAKLAGPEITPIEARLSNRFSPPRILAPEFGETEIKLGEARFFLEFIRQNTSHHALILYGLSAFLSAARSVTLYLQAEGKGTDDFEDWYELKRDELKNDSFAKFLKDTRDISAHKMYAEIKLTLVVDAKAESYSVGFEFNEHEFKPGLLICDEYLDKLQRFIAEAKDRNYLRERTHTVRFGVKTK